MPKRVECLHQPVLGRGMHLVHLPRLLGLLLLLTCTGRAARKPSAEESTPSPRRAGQRWRRKRRHTSARAQRGHGPSLQPGDLRQRCRPHPRRRSRLSPWRVVLLADLLLLPLAPLHHLHRRQSRAVMEGFSEGHCDRLTLHVAAWSAVVAVAASSRLRRRHQHATTCRQLGAQEKFNTQVNLVEPLVVVVVLTGVS